MVRWKAGAGRGSLGGCGVWTIPPRDRPAGPSARGEPSARGRPMGAAPPSHLVSTCLTLSRLISAYLGFFRQKKGAAQVRYAAACGRLLAARGGARIVWPKPEAGARARRARLALHQHAADQRAGGLVRTRPAPGPGAGRRTLPAGALARARRRRARSLARPALRRGGRRRHGGVHRARLLRARSLRPSRRRATRTSTIPPPRR